MLCKPYSTKSHILRVLSIASVLSADRYYQDSKIYRWNGVQFLEFRSIPTVGESARALAVGLPEHPDDRGEREGACSCT